MSMSWQVTFFGYSHEALYLNLFYDDITLNPMEKIVTKW